MITIYNFTASLVNELKQVGRYSTAGLYKSSVNSFLRFNEELDTTFQDLTPEIIKNFETLLLLNGKKENTTSSYMRMLHSITHQAIETGIKLNYPIKDLFNAVFMGYKNTAKRAISISTINKLILLNLEAQPSLCFSRDLFLLSIYLRGISFVDLMHLRKSDIKDDTIYYFRKKTKKQLSVKIEPCIAQILNRYQTKSDSSPYLLPMLTLTGEAEYKQYRSALKLYNDHLHQISKMIGLKNPLTSYVARHSWATIAKYQGVSIALISEGLGHSSEKITKIYLNAFENSMIDNANKTVLNAISPKEKSKEKKEGKGKKK